MDGNYWTAGLINTSSTPKTAGVVDANRLNLVDLSQYGTVDQASLEFLLSQQRLTAQGKKYVCLPRPFGDLVCLR
jgi:hypothetical protein